jgi:hypothetical protein
MSALPPKADICRRRLLSIVVVITPALHTRLPLADGISDTET